ncbi:MAG: M14 family metallopeptidase [Candidatus Sericytochromatia bacterium]|nr:M14 family metallopeptidase [Candidatus Sericytochromatia bacterium]
MKSTSRIALHAALLLSTFTVALAGCGATGRLPVARETMRGFSAVTFSSSTEGREAILFYKDRDRLTKLASAGVDIWSVDIAQRRAKVKLNESQAKLAEQLGMEVEWPIRQTVLRADKGYRDYDQIVSRMKELQAKHPEFVQMVDIGDSWEKTQGIAEREIWALHLNTGGGEKPNVTIAGCHHAREIVTPEITLKMAEDLIDSYGQDAEVTGLVDTRDLWIIPLVNPDAHIHAVKGVDRRKNANNLTGGKRRIGVDLNRNYDIAWGTVGDSGNPEADTFRGAKPFSEPETQAIRDQLLRHKPVVYLTFHSYANSVMWPWDHQSAPPPDPRLAQLGSQLGALSGYKAYQGAKMYLNSGDDVDWAFAKLGSLAYTVEIGGWNDGFMPPSSRLPKFWNENRPMMLHAMKVADNPGQTFGPPVQLQGQRGAITMTAAPDVRRAEAFLGRPGRPGSGKAVTLKAGQARLEMASESRQPLWVHAQGRNGIWGPWQITWSR